MIGPRVVILLFFQAVVIQIGVFAQGPDIGKIYIGTQRNASDPTEYVFNNNHNLDGGTQQVIPFSAVVISGVDGTEVSRDDRILVTCLNEFANTPGYTQVTFSSENVPPEFPGGSVSFSTTSIGRAAVVRCYGVSVALGSQCPATSNPTIQQPEFCQETSLSDPVTIVMTPSPVVSVCEQVVPVPSSSTSGTFEVKLSEAVRGGNVTVTCQEVSPPFPDDCNQMGVSCCRNRNGNINVDSASVSVGQTTAMMRFRITNTNNQNICVGVRCQASSLSSLPEGYRQYLTSTSSDSSSEALIQTPTGTRDMRMAPQYLSIYNTSFQSVLYLDTSIDVPFQCQASVVSSLEEALRRTDPANIDCTFIFANATTTAITTASTTAIPAPATTTDVNAATGDTTLPATMTPLPTPPADPSSPWITVDNSFTITTENKFHVVRTNRFLQAIAPVQEMVVTTCCSTNSNNLRVAAVAVVELEPRLNSTGGVTSGEAGEERFVVNPAYREVAPCPCDLTYLACDVNCCCDGECTDADKQTFGDCIPGPAGGLDRDPDLRSCRSGHFPKDDWFPLMCVQFESNAFLGQFYTKADKLTTALATSEKLKEEKKDTVYTYRETEPRFSDLAVVSGYTQGSNILTISSEGAAGNLLLPQRMSSGLCLDSTPVQFLRNSESACVRTLTQESCRDLTPFSARVYAVTSSLYTPACLTSFSISATGRSLQENTDLVNVQVNYHCASDTDAYVKATASSLVSPETLYSFTQLQDINCTDVCGADSVCADYNRGRGESSSSALPPRCSFDNGFTLPPVPTFSAGTCNNVVLDVRYRLSWAGQTITGLTADVVLGSVTLGSAAGSEVGVSQMFLADFTHDYSGPANQSDNYESVATPYQRAGRPGYDYGKPVATGCGQAGDTAGSSLPVDQGEVNQMAVWSPGINGLCQNARRRFLTFGDDMQASCILRLALGNINNCDSLKRLVLNHLNVLMPANVIGRYGYNDPGNEDMWIEILRDDPFPSTTTPATTTTTTAAAATTASTPTSPENRTFDPLSVRGGVCRNMASGVHLEILYAETSRNNRYPVLEIVGAAVKYTVSNWSMLCVGDNSRRCEGGSLFTQPFLVSSSVQFTRVSAATPQPPALFYQIHDKESCDSDTCYRFFQDFDTSVCHYDTCWHELFYPIVQGYPGSEGVNYTRGFSLVLFLFILGYVSVTKPWK